jgi:HTH-type transcriptional regulator, competence development regulator
MSLGEKVRATRQRKGMNQKELAKASGITPATVSRVEKGQVKQLKSDALKRLARALGVTIDELVDLDPSEEERIDKLFEFVSLDPEFKYGTRLTGNLSTEAKRFIIELYEKIRDKKLL